MRAGAFRVAAALVAVVALASCESVGLGSLDPFAEPDETEAAVAAEPEPAEGGYPPLPKPRPEPGASEEAEADAAAETEDAAPDGAADRVAAADAEPPADSAAAAGAPHIYMALQPDRAGSTSVVFAIDRSRDGTPSDEPAIRISPEETEAKSGRCNPQQLRYYNFPPESADRPVYGPEEASRGVGPEDLPGFMATAVSSEMIDSGIADDLEDTRPQNVCTRKLFEQTIIAATTGQG